MPVPATWRAYQCEDYFACYLADSGWWDDDGQCWYIEPASKVHEDGERKFLIIGGPGVDGIRWGYRQGHPGIWAFFPVEEEFRIVAASAMDLREGFASGRITV